MGHGSWQKSSFSGEGANCVHVAVDKGGEGVNLMESDTPDTILGAAPQALRCLIGHIKTGRLDRRG
ncbi:hypothetical protein ADK70_11140 [Streptomyces rimosus subsp. pseudoverticillatus]|uniref:DUF397 domain-containing protein n=1 Tax=Streptomyces rimosus TaxID=1927 RepID=UPI0006B286CB|nr:DUF397 domain-containing protein [Streptomyces rimosus]KOT95317.1 hypothetical protein ADK70_11140 [Streptomyces rimosus subsp. pseudoverticillatus]